MFAEPDGGEMAPIPSGLPSPEANVVIVIGAPGSGKKLYCQKIAKKYEGFVHLSMGDLLKAKLESQPGEEPWSAALERMKVGELVPMGLCRSLMHAAIHEHPEAWGFVLEGYPRTAEQAKDFEANVERVDLVLLIDCTEAFCAKTLRERDGAELDEVALKTRLAAFKTATLPMLKHFDETGKLKVVRAKPRRASETTTFLSHFHSSLTTTLVSLSFLSSLPASHGFSLCRSVSFLSFTHLYSHLLPA